MSKKSQSVAQQDVLYKTTVESLLQTYGGSKYRDVSELDMQTHILDVLAALKAQLHGPKAMLVSSAIKHCKRAPTKEEMLTSISELLLFDL